MSSKCSVCGKSYKNLRLHEVKAHESFRISVKYDEEGSVDLNIYYTAGSVSCKLSYGEFFDGGDISTKTYVFPENTHPKYYGIAVNYPAPLPEKFTKEDFQLYYGGVRQLTGFDLDLERLVKVSQDRITLD